MQTAVISRKSATRVIARASSSSADDRDVHPWRAAVCLSALLLGIAFLWSMVIEPGLHEVHGWLPPGDVWPSLTAAHYVANGALGYVYEASPVFVATPLGAVVLTPVAFLGQLFHMTESLSPFPVAYPTVWPLYATFGMALGIPVLFAARALGRQVISTASGAAIQWAVVLLVIMPLSVLWGHYEDVLALAFVMLAVRELLKGRYLRAALLMSVAIGFKQWALLGLPLVVAYAPSSKRLRAVAYGFALPALLTGFTLVIDWPHASRALFHARAFPGTRMGHAALWLSKLHGPTVVGTPFRIGAVVASIAVAYRMRKRQGAGSVLAAFAVVFFARLLFEPVIYMYYLAPALGFLLLHERFTAGRYRRTVVVGAGLMALFSVPLPRLLWWACATILSIPLLARAVRDLLDVRPEAPLETSAREMSAVGRTA